MADLHEADAPSLPVLMARVLGDLPAIGKDEQAPGSMGGYNFRGIEAITAALKPLLAKHEVFCMPTTLERVDGGRQVGNNKTMWVVDVHVRFTFYGPAGDTLTCSTWGEGTDMGDKATQKAYTSAFKSMLGQVFCVADSATDSERHEVPDTERAPAPSLASVDAARLVAERIKVAPESIRATIKERMAETQISFTRSLTTTELGTVEAWLDELLVAPPGDVIRGDEPPDALVESQALIADWDDDKIRGALGARGLDEGGDSVVRRERLIRALAAEEVAA